MSATAETRAIEGGFADPVLDAQRAFRALMDAMASPGRIVPLAVDCDPPAPLRPVAGAIAATLLDADTKLWLDRPLATSAAVPAWLRFQTGAALMAEAAEADFALVADMGQLGTLDHFARGTAEYPDRSTTLVLQLDGFDGGQTLVLAGPGIPGERRFAPATLPPRFVEQWDANRAAFPRGVDLVFAGPGAIAAMPRSTRILRIGE